MSILYVPPSYGVPGGPGKAPRRFVTSSSSPTGSAVIWEWVSARMSAISFVIRRVRLDAMGANIARGLGINATGTARGEVRS